MVKVAICAGHGGFGVTPGKRTPDGEYEWDFNNKVVVAFINELKNYKNVQILRTDDPTGKTDVPLKTRTDKANSWGADYYISFHHNANTGRWGDWTGVETHVYKSKPANAVRLAKAIHPALVKAYGLRDRGIKYTNLHITRETKMTAILLEGGFMDSRIDIKKLRDDNVLKNVGIAVAQAFAEYVGLKRVDGGKVSTPSKSTGAKNSTATSKTISQMADEIIAGKHGSGHENRRKSLGISKEEYEKVRAEVNRKLGLSTPSTPKSEQTTVKPKPKKVASASSDIKVGDKVTVKSSAKKYATGENIPSFVKGKKYTVQQVKSDRVLLKEILSWVKKSDVTKNSSSTASKPTDSKPSTKSSSGSSKSGKYGKLKIINVNNAAIVMDKPDRINAKNIGTVKKGATLPLNGSVRGKNSSSGYWEVEFNGRLGYITGKYGKRV